MVCSKAWLDVLEDSTVCLREGRSVSEEELDECLVYLSSLETILRGNEAKWDYPPLCKPPPFEPSRADSSEHKTEPIEAAALSPVGDYNPYASFQDSYEDSDDYFTTDDEDDAGDRIVKRPPEETNTSASTMDMRRLLIRVLDHQSSLFARKAIICQRMSPPRWEAGSHQYGASVQYIHNALVLADSQISKWFAEDNPEHAMYQPLLEDANIVEVSIQTMSKNRDSFLKAARRQEALLMKKLEPQYQSRDAARSRMGDRWYENPRPTGYYAQLRKAGERQLRDVRQALESMENIDARLQLLTKNATHLKNRLLSTGNPTARQRYNGMRPYDVSGRVDFTLYPDPTEFGWTFTGSSMSVEFFEKDGVQLDFYYTVAIVETSLMHPKQGKTRLLSTCKAVDPDSYISILFDPRIHAGDQCHRRSY